MLQKIWKPSYEDKLQNVTDLMICQKIQICCAHIGNEAKWKPQETLSETFSWNQTIEFFFFTIDSTLQVSHVYDIVGSEWVVREHNWEKCAHEGHKMQREGYGPVLYDH